RDRPRSALFSFRRRESDVRYPGFSANVQYTDDIFVSASFIATNHYGLLRVELNQTFEQLRQLGARESAPVYNHVAVRFYIYNHVPDRRTFFFRGRSLRHLDVQLVFVPGRVPSKEEKDQQQQQDIDQWRELNARMMQLGATTQIHVGKMPIFPRRRDSRR